MMLVYMDWLNSNPFDIGNTCNNVFDVFRHWQNGGAGPKEKCIPLVCMLNKQSEANGALMQATAIASYIGRFHPRDIQMGLFLAEQSLPSLHRSQPDVHLCSFTVVGRDHSWQISEAIGCVYS